MLAKCYERDRRAPKKIFLISNQLALGYAIGGLVAKHMMDKLIEDIKTQQKHFKTLQISLAWKICTLIMVANQPHKVAINKSQILSSCVL
jgi:hypothetical protein